MPSLHDVQHAIWRSLLRHEDDAAADLIVGAGLAPAQRLGIYRNTMVSTLANALRLSFPAVYRLVGADFFEGAAQIFARDHAPRCADLNAYGAEFPDFLQGFAPAATLAYLADVARLEWAVNRALHAPDADVLTMERLATVAPADHDKVSLAVQPSVSTLRSNFPVDAIWRAVLDQDETAMAAIDLRAGPVCLVVQRLAGRVDVAPVEEGAWPFVAALCAGQPLGAALAASTDVDAPAVLAEFLTAGRFVAFHLECHSNENEREEYIL